SVLLTPPQPGFGRLLDVSPVVGRHRILSGDPAEGPVPMTGSFFQFPEQQREDGRPHLDDLAERGVGHQVGAGGDVSRVSEPDGGQSLELLLDTLLRLRRRRLFGWYCGHDTTSILTRGEPQANQRLVRDSTASPGILRRLGPTLTATGGTR